MEFVIPRKPESGYGKAFWTPVFDGVTTSRNFYEPSKLETFLFYLALWQEI
jgi:hypothetical protein